MTCCSWVCIFHPQIECSSAQAAVTITSTDDTLPVEAKEDMVRDASSDDVITKEELTSDNVRLTLCLSHTSQYSLVCCIN